MDKVRRSLVLCGWWLLAALAPSQVGEFGVLVPMGGGPMPNYWSGTNCRASGYAQVGDTIYKAQLLLNGEVVHFWEAPPGSELPLSIGLKVMFDSTHYANGTNVEVTFKVWGSETGLHEKSSSPDPVVKNKLMMYRDPSPPTPDPQPTVLGFMQSKNYIIQMEGGNSWQSSDYFSAMYGSNVIHYSGHGTKYYHTAPVGQGMHHEAYLTEREYDIGAGLPPFNSGDVPSVNFFHLQACNCGDDINFKKALYPYYMGWGGPYLENQALLTYTCYTLVSDRIKNSHLIWEKLSAGSTIRAVHNWIRFVYLPGNAYGIMMKDTDPGPTREFQIADLNLICNPMEDGAMRVKSVYTGDHSPPQHGLAEWVRPL